MFWDYDLVTWALYNYNTLRSGEWPDRKQEDIQMRHHALAYHAPFESSCLLAAEVAIRVKWCGLDGMLCEERFGMTASGNMLSESEIAYLRRLPVDEVARRINRVTHYVADRPAVSYDSWKHETKYERRIRDVPMFATATTARMMVS